MNTLKHLESYYEGRGCKCEARSSNECGCHDVDWTPKAVYELRAERDSLQIALEEISNLAKTLKAERDEAREKYATEATEHMLAVNKLCGERDAARERCAKFRDIAERAVSLGIKGKTGRIKGIVEYFNGITKFAFKGKTK